MRFPVGMHLVSNLTVGFNVAKIAVGGRRIRRQSSMMATVDVGFEGDGAVAVDAAGIAVQRRIFLRQYGAPMRFAFQMDI